MFFRIFFIGKGEARQTPSLQCTESLNDPVILLGVLFRLRKLEMKGLKYNSPEFAQELEDLSNNVKDSIGVNLAGRIGERNLIRNSGQYWRAVGLLEDGDKTGLIRLTDFGRRVAERFLSNYGYLNKQEGKTRMNEQYFYNSILDIEITNMLAEKIHAVSLVHAVTQIRNNEIASEIERKRVEENIRIKRPNQAKFRKEVLQACERCVITNVTMPEVLEAAHIKPFKYNGEDTIENGFAMRMDIHLLFDSGHLRISDNGTIELSVRARMDYGASIPPRIVLPVFTNKEFLKWRWENYNGL